MDWKNQLTKTPYLVLFIVLISIGVGTASALITITLSGDVVITGFLDMTGDKIANVDTPTLASDAATKAYVDSAPDIDTLALLGCTNDQIALFFGGVWTCFTLTTYTDEDAIIAVGPHTSDTLEGLACAADEIAKSDGGGGWSCQPDDSQLGFTSTYVNDFFLTSAGQAKVQCDLGDIATGGGFILVAPGDISNSFPIDINGNAIINSSFEQPTGYAATTQTAGVRVMVVCADFAPAHVP